MNHCARPFEIMANSTPRIRGGKPIVLGLQFSRRVLLTTWIGSSPALHRLYHFRPLVESWPSTQEPMLATWLSIPSYYHLTICNKLSQLDVHEDILYPLSSAHIDHGRVPKTLNHKDTPHDARPIPTIGTPVRYLAVVGGIPTKDPM